MTKENTLLIDEFKKDGSLILQHAFESRTPISCTLEITTKCNFNCVHCYLVNKHDTIMDLDVAKKLLKEMKILGTLFLTVTGGEVLTHPYFKEIYSYAAEIGLIITVLTNGYLIDDDIIELFKAYPPRKIEVTLYGINQEVFLEVTRSGVYAKKVLDNIVRLKKEGFYVLCKMMLLKENQQDFLQIINFAKSIDCQFIYDFNVLPSISGDRSVMIHELDVDDVIEYELLDGTNRLERWKFMIRNYDYQNNKKLNCGCGKFSYMISADLYMRKCNFIAENNIKENLSKYSLSKVWEYWKSEVEEPRFPKCVSCSYQALCDICPSISSAMNGLNQKNSPVTRQCQLAKRRFQYVKDHESNSY